MVLLEKKIIPMFQDKIPAKLKVEVSKSVDTPKLRTAILCLMPLLEESFQLLSMLPTGQPTGVVSSLIVVTDLTMVLPWSESMEETGGSRTPGDLDGEKTDSSELLLETLVVSVAWLSIPTSETNPYDQIIEPII
jgi:hypothetical protein